MEMEQQVFEKDDKVYVILGKEKKPGLVVKIIKENRYLVKVLVSKPTAKTKTFASMRFNGKNMSRRFKGPIIK